MTDKNFAVYENKPNARRWKHRFQLHYGARFRQSDKWYEEFYAIEHKDCNYGGDLFDDKGYDKMLALLQKFGINVISQEEFQQKLKTEAEAREAADTRDDVQKLVDSIKQRHDVKWFDYGWWQCEFGLEDELKEAFDYDGDYDPELLQTLLKQAQAGVFGQIKQLQKLADELQQPIDILANRPADYYDD